MFDKFSERHIGVSNEKDLKAMLDVIGVKSVDELISQVIPQSIRLRKPLALPAEGMSEYEFAAHIRELADRNQPYRSFIGMGYYPSAVPAVVTRNVFENPAWYTSYTPYQAEISQGRLEALLNFQTAVISLTGMEIGNCSLLDEGTAAAAAMAMMFSLRSRDAVREGRNQLFVDRNIFPQTLDVLLTRSEPFGIELIVDDYDEYEFTGREFGAIVQYPAADGRVRDYSDFTAAAHAKGALVTVAADLLSLALLKAPGEWGADIAVGSAQRLGTPMGFGGPAAGYMTTREAFKRNMPGRIIGVSVDRLGNKALRMALQMREQHIKRERATSNICTASALMASMTGFYCVYNGPEGLRRAAETAHLAAATVARALEAMDYRLASKEFFDTLEVEAEAAVVQSLALEQGINFYYPSEGRVRMSFDAVTTALTTISTGGFSVRNESIAYYQSSAVNWIIVVFMFVSSVNFTLLFLAGTRRWREVLRSDELRVYSGIVFGSSALIALDLVLKTGRSVGSAIEHAAFQVTTLISTTGYCTEDFDRWPQFSRLVLLVVMFAGGCAGSTAGGIKVSRIVLLFKGLKRDLRRILHTREVRPITLDGQRVEEDTISSVSLFFFAYMIILFFSALIVSLDELDFTSAFTASLTCISNVGPGLGLVGPTCNFGFLSPLSKLVLSFTMLLGRLEIMPLLVLFLPSVWRKK